MIQKFGISIQDTLLEEFDQFIKQKGYKSRSKAIRDLIIEKLTEQKEIDLQTEVFFIIATLLDPKTKFYQKIIETMKEYENLTIFSSHFSFKGNIIFIFIGTGNFREFIKFRDRLCSMKEVKLLKEIILTI